MRHQVQRIINLNVSDFWDADKKRIFRQVNAFNIFLGLISCSAIFVAWWFDILPGLIIQTTTTLVYFSGFWLVRRGKINMAKNIGIYTFELHIFVVSLFAVFPTNHPSLPFYSPVFIVYTIYPLVAALFDMSVFRHMLMAFLQILILQFSDVIIKVLNIDIFPADHRDFLNVVVCIYTLFIASLIVYWVYNENKIVKNLEIERSRQLEIVLNELKEKQQKIKKQKENLQQLNAMKNKFFSIISHDLKSPFNAILGFSELLMENNYEKESFRHYARTLNGAAKNVYNLLENLLNWSRSQLDHIRFNPCKSELHNLVNHAVEELKAHSSSKNIVINNQVNIETTIHADQELTGVVLRNLLSNAIKYTMPGGTVVVYSEDQPKHTLIAVRDNGVGISEKHLKKLFKIDSKESMPGTLNETGTGLGLILTKEFVEKHNGKVWAESIEGAGSTFFFTIPKQ